MTGRSFYQPAQGNQPTPQPPPQFQQPQQQQPGNVPDARLDQMQREMRELRDQNQQLRGQVDHMSRASQPNAKPPDQPFFKPEVAQALDQKFNPILQQIRSEFQQATGMMMDQTDQAKFELRYRGTKLESFVAKVEDQQRSLQSQGKWLPREQILQQLYFEETGRKAQDPQYTQTQAPPAQPPQYDTYTGQWRDPATNQVVAPPTQVVVPQGAPPQAAQVQEYGQQQQGQQQYPNGYQPPPPQQAFAPQPNQNQWAPQLPNAQPPPAGPGVASSGTPQGLTLDATPETAKAWADKFGDIPL
jgi:hypothetical protein